MRRAAGGRAQIFIAAPRGEASRICAATGAASAPPEWPDSITATTVSGARLGRKPANQAMKSPEALRVLPVLPATVTPADARTLRGAKLYSAFEAGEYGQHLGGCGFHCQIAIAERKFERRHQNSGFADRLEAHSIECGCVWLTVQANPRRPSSRDNSPGSNRSAAWATKQLQE